MLDWLLRWFAENRDIALAESQKHLDENFFELGYIDSFGFIMLIASVEEELHISFDNDQFQDRSFSTIRGFADALERMKTREV